MNGPNRIRSTTAPETSAAVITQKLPWKAKNRSWGMLWPSSGAKPTSLRRAWSKPPMIALPSEKANEYPTSAQETIATPSAAAHIMNVFRVFFERTSPA